jgi:cell division protein FtsI/penicillin-binding protein 2
MRNCPKTCALALLLFVFPAGVLTNLNTTKNEELRAAVERAMEGRTGAAVVADVVTGEILAAHEIDLAAHRLLRPGSTVKPFVLMALLESGKLNARQRLVCRRPLRIGGVRMD